MRAGHTENCPVGIQHIYTVRGWTGQAMKLLGISRLKIILPFLCLACGAWLIAWRYVKITILHGDYVNLQVQISPRVVVGISSFGQRVFHMGPTLDSIARQIQVPDRVIVSIPKTPRRPESEKTACPSWALDCASDPVQYDESQQGVLAWFEQRMGPLVSQTGPGTFEFRDSLTVLFLDTDWGAGTKVLGALTLERDQTTILISLDDDVVYPPNTVKWLATHLGHGMALSFGCEKWNDHHRAFWAYSPTNSLVTSSQSYNLVIASTSYPRVCDGWLLGWTAVAYRVGHFGPDIWTFLNTLPRGCFFSDDIWLSGYLAHKGIIRVYAPGILKHLYHRRDKALSISTLDNLHDRYTYPCARALFE